jgi:hypothetical protein
LVEDQGDVLVLVDRCGELIEELTHRLGVGVRQHEGEGIVDAGVDGREDEGECEAFIAQARRPLAALPPDAAHAAFLTDARPVLEKQAQALLLMRTLKFFRSCEALSFKGLL